jgi:type II secretory ATPase GspE/PulE/Tfp pilus assembly ATPase PilB-like protein
MTILARYIASRQLAESGQEAVILDKIKSGSKHLAAVFKDWKIDAAQQQEMFEQCLGFTRLDAPLSALGHPVVPQRPPALVDFVASRPVILFRPSSARAVVATTDPLLAEYRDQLALLLGCAVEMVHVTPAELDVERQLVSDKLAESGAPTKADLRAASYDIEDESGPIVQMVDLTIREAVTRKASDIHVEPFEQHGIVRYRIDGVLHKAREYPIELHASVASRIKLISAMDIAEKRVPQDGRIRFTGHGADLDLRVSSTPSAHGETIVMRLLARASVKVDLAKGGFREETLASFRKSFSAPNGIVLVTGPTGSGKTTTLYGAVNELNDIETKIFTIEDPIEYQLEGIVQIPVKAKVGLTFAAALRAALRQDPDIIMIGEIRDTETAEIAIQSALTGHLVLATLHTNSAPATLTRLIDMGIPAYNLSATMQSVLAQRLVRRVCPGCVRDLEATRAERTLFEQEGVPLPGSLAEGAGCDACQGSGCVGRMGIHEFMVLTDTIRTAVNKAVPETELERIARQEGMKTLLQDGLIKAAARQTTLKEVLRCVGGGA